MLKDIKIEDNKKIPPNTQIINSTWIVGKKISSGSFGVVYQIENIKTKEQLAAKLETNNNSDDILSVLREAFLMGKLQNITGIPKVLWSGSEGHHDIMVQQLLGKDLGSYLRILKTMCLKTVVEIGIQSINIVRQFHEKNIIHRDLKPENMIMGRKGENHQVYIVDFGISKFYKNSKG